MDIPKPRYVGILKSRVYCLLSAAIPLSALSAEPLNAGEATGFNLWGAVIAVFVCSVAASVAYLCYGAIRLWEGYWRILAIAPLFVLALWISLLVTTTLLSSELRPLWSFELLAWAMTTTVYQVILFTARRTFEKAAAETAGKTLDD